MCHVLKDVEQVVTVEDDATTAEALRLCLPRISCPTVLIMRLGAVTDLPLRTLLSVYSIDGNAAAIVLLKRKTSAASQTKAGKTPKVRFSVPQTCFREGHANRGWTMWVSTTGRSDCSSTIRVETLRRV